MTVAWAASMPRGMLRAGRRISSATLQILVTPLYETKTKPAPATMPPMPAGKAGW
jgi:hypothetical protein